MFNERNTTQRYITDTLRDLGWQVRPASALGRAPHEVFLLDELRAALQRLNPAIAAQPARAAEVIYQLQTIVQAVHSEGLVRANQRLAAWLGNEHTMPFGENHQHLPLRLIDYDDLSQNSYITAEEVTCHAGDERRRFDHVLFVNGLPLVVGEAKTPVRPAWSWVDAAEQIHRYEEHVPAFFVPNVLSFASEGKGYRYGAVQTPLQHWGPWYAAEPAPEGLPAVGAAVRAMLTPQVLLDLLRHFTTYATSQRGQLIKIIARYQQYYAALKIVRRVLAGRPRQGLIWHFQGSGKSLLMLFAAQLLRRVPQLQRPTVLIIVDRVDLDAQISGTFLANDVANVVTTDKREELQALLRAGVRKIIITTIHKFATAEAALNESDQVIVLVDEAHRTQEGDLGRAMRQALPHAFLFGLTGTPINKQQRNTFYAFGAETDTHGYLDRYSFEESIRDHATLPLTFEARLVELHVDQVGLDEAYAQMTGHLSATDQAQLAQAATHLAVLLKAPPRIARIAEDIATHFQQRVAPNGFKGMVVAFDRETCVAYKRALDQHLPPEASDVVMTVGHQEAEYRPFARDKGAEERLLEQFRDPDHPLQLLIVTAKLLAGFDAPILQVMYLDKPLKEHTLLQAITRTNRVYVPPKSHGLIVDYVGVFDDVTQSMRFDEAQMRRVVQNIAALKAQLPEAVAACLFFFTGIDRTVTGYEGLLTAQECLPTDAVRDEFAAAFAHLHQLWEALSPDPALRPYRADYAWLAQVHQSVKPSSGQGQLLWHALGAKTLALIHDHITVLGIRDDLETLLLDARFLTELLDQQSPRALRELESKLMARLRRHGHEPRFVALGVQVEALRRRHEQGLLNTLAFLQQLLQLAREVVEAEKESPPPALPPEAQGMAALTALLREVQHGRTPKMVERIVHDIDEIVRHVRFPDWQSTHKGERLVKQALRQTLAKYQLHREEALFERAYGYIAAYY